MKFRHYVAALLLICNASRPAFGKCSEWGEAKEVMKLEPSVLPEASGLLVSRKHKDTFYQVNDSGDGPYIYASTTRTGKTRKIKIESFTPTDVEDLAYGPCGRSECIVLGDIGDNKLKRSHVNLIVFEEPEVEATSLKPSHIVRVKYPDGPHNAEGLAIHPNGDLFVVTKEKNKKGQPLYARLYRLEAGKWQAKSDQEVRFTFAAEISLPPEKRPEKPSAKKITSMDIHPGGDRFILLTYEKAIEFELNLTKLKQGSRIADTYRYIDIPAMTKQESIAYAPNGNGFFYTSESNKKKVEKSRQKGIPMKDAAIVLVECKK